MKSISRRAFARLTPRLVARLVLCLLIITCSLSPVAAQLSSRPPTTQAAINARAAGPASASATPATAAPASIAAPPAAVNQQTSADQATNAPAQTQTGPSSDGAMPSNSATSSDSATTPAQAAGSTVQQGDERLPFLAHEEEEREAPSAGGLLLRALGALLLIVGLIVAAAWGMKRFGGGRFGASEADAPALRVLTSVALGDKRSLAVVRFGGRTLLVGSTAQSLTLLAEDDAAIDEDALSAALPARSVAELLEDEITEGALVFPAPEAVPHSFAGELSIARQRYAAPAAMPPFSKGASNV